MGTKICSAPNCAARHYANGICKRHYTQMQRHGRLTPETERPQVRPNCAADGCKRTSLGRVKGEWYCQRHMRQIQVHGRLTPEREHVMGRTRCKVHGCTDPHRARGLCAKHYNGRRWLEIKKIVKKHGGKV